MDFLAISISITIQMDKIVRVADKVSIIEIGEIIVVKEN